MDIRVAVIGCGHWGKNHVRTFAALKALAALCDADVERAQSLARQYGVAARSLDEILADASIAAVVIAAPAAQHYSLARQALEAGKDVLVEKPLALDIGQGEELCALAQQSGRVLMVGHLLRYHPAFVALQKLVETGTLGSLRYVYSHRLNLGRIRGEEDVWYSFAPHDISMILALAKMPPQRIDSNGACALQPGIDDNVTARLDFPGGLQAHIFASWLHPFKEHRLVVVGSDGMAVFDDNQPWERKLLHYPHRIDGTGPVPQAVKAEAVAIPLPQAEPLEQECRHFLQCVADRSQPVTGGEEGLAVLRVLQAGSRQPAPYFVHDTATVDDGCTIGKGTKIWHFSHILPGVTIGDQVIVGQNVMIGPKVSVGNRCKIQNNVSLYTGVTLEDGVFCGPSCVFTNVRTPRAEIERKDEFLPTRVGQGASIGANATILCGNAIGAYAMIGAGAVVTHPVKAHALVIGNPARQVGWVSHAGEVLREDMICQRSGRRYTVNAQGNLVEITTEDEDDDSAGVHTREKVA